MLRPVIMIGCGGSGVRTVHAARKKVASTLRAAGWEDGIPKGWQFIGIDQELRFWPKELLDFPHQDFVDIGHFAAYQQLDNAVMARFGPRGVRPEAFQELLGWRPNPTQVATPMGFSGQSRAVGRMSGVLAMQDRIRERVLHAFNQCAAGGPELSAVSEKLGIEVPIGVPTPPPIVLIIGSTAGGTGAGIMLDVVEIVRQSHVHGAFPVLVALTPDIFGSVQNDLMTANSAAFMSEMLSAYWDNEPPEDLLFPHIVFPHVRGPHSVFFLGRRNLEGVDLKSPENVYRTVGGVLAAITMSESFQQNFVHFVTDWEHRSHANAGGYGFAPQSFPGVASSFGSTTISLGRDRFREYIQKLLHRSIIEHLAVGFETESSSVFDENENQAMSPAEKIAGLAQMNAATFLNKCGLERQQIEDQFLTREIMRQGLDEVSQSISALLSASMRTLDKARKKWRTENAVTWLSIVLARAQQSKDVRKQKADAEINDQIRNWSSKLYRQVLRTSTEFSASLSIPVVLSLIEIARADAIKTAAELREKAMEDRLSSARAESQARTRLANVKGNLALPASPVQETIRDISKEIVWEWSADVRERLAVTLESVASSMFASIEGGLRQANGRIHAMMTPQDGQPSAIASWPRNTNEVPSTFAPSPVEFYLEDYTNWPQRAKELISSSLENREGLPSDPVEAARTLIISGGYGGSDNGHAVRPFIWGEGHGTEPEWEAGQSVSIVVDDSMAGLSGRIDAWLTRPASDLHRTLSEGLATYLMPNDSVTGKPIEDHTQRLHVFAAKLQIALMGSRPLIQIDESLNAVVHPRTPSYSLSIQGFPFGVGHPARQVTEQIIQGFLKTAEPVDWAFTSAESESVFISNFLDYPVNPSVIMSFTHPLSSALNNFTEDRLQSAFWKWRRAQTLHNFIPLPSELRIALIRGFAVARALGVMSLETRQQNVIADREGDKSFPKYLLTPVDRNNLLPGLLEAMVLTFADTNTRGEQAFGAYATLIDYGSNELGVGDFAVGGLLRHYLEFGDHNGVRIVDQDRANTVRGDNLSSRAERICEYLERNIQRFDDLERVGPDERSWRNLVGTVEPVDTLTLEILPELQKAYKEVLDAIRYFH